MLCIYRPALRPGTQPLPITQPSIFVKRQQLCASGNSTTCLCLLVGVSLPLFTYGQCWPPGRFFPLDTDLFGQQQFATQASRKRRAKCESVSPMFEAWIFSGGRGIISWDHQWDLTVDLRTSAPRTLQCLFPLVRWWSLFLGESFFSILFIYLIYRRCGAPACGYFVLLKSKQTCHVSYSR